jgi:glutaredoxin-related protein
MTKSIVTVINTLASNNAKVVYANDYKRITAKVNDNFNMFKADKETIITSLANNIVTSGMELNFSIRNKIYGEVQLNPKTAKAVGLDKTIRCHIYRNQSYVVNGTVNIPTMEVIVPKKFVDNMDFLENIKKYSENEVRATVNLLNRPITDDTAVDNKKFVDMLEVLNNASIKNKVAKYLNNTYFPNPYANKYTEEQIEVLKQYGVTSDNVYEGIDNEKEINGARQTREIEVYIKGLKTVPSINATLKKIESGKKLNAFDTAINNELDKQNDILANMDINEKREYLKNLVKRTGVKVANARVNLNTSKAMAILNNTLFNNAVEKKSKDNTITYEVDCDGNTLVINDKYTDVAI